MGLLKKKVKEQPDVSPRSSGRLRSSILQLLQILAEKPHQVITDKCPASAKVADCSDCHLLSVPGGYVVCDGFHQRFPTEST